MMAHGHCGLVIGSGYGRGSHVQTDPSPLLLLKWRKTIGSDLK